MKISISVKVSDLKIPAFSVLVISTFPSNPIGFPEISRELWLNSMGITENSKDSVPAEYSVKCDKWPSPTGNSLKVRLESINDENDKVFSRIGDCSQLKEFVQKIFKTCMNPAERVLKMIKNLEKITFRKWKKWWNQKWDFL